MPGVSGTADTRIAELCPQGNPSSRQARAGRNAGRAGTADRPQNFQKKMLAAR